MSQLRAIRRGKAAMWLAVATTQQVIDSIDEVIEMTKQQSQPQRRWKCNACGTEGWMTPGQRVAAGEGHARPDGRVCRQPQVQVSAASKVLL